MSKLHEVAGKELEKVHPDWRCMHSGDQSDLIEAWICGYKHLQSKLKLENNE